MFAEAIVLGLCQRKFFQLLFCRLLGIIRQSVLVSRLWVEILADTVAVPAGRSSERPAPIFRQRSYKLPISSSFISYILSHFNEPFKKLFWNPPIFFSVFLYDRIIAPHLSNKPDSSRIFPKFFSSAPIGTPTGRRTQEGASTSPESRRKLLTQIISDFCSTPQKWGCPLRDIPICSR